MSIHKCVWCEGFYNGGGMCSCGDPTSIEMLRNKIERYAHDAQCAETQLAELARLAKALTDHILGGMFYPAQYEGDFRKRVGDLATYVATLDGAAGGADEKGGGA